jgi:ribosomal protein S28E/S33
MSNALEAEIVGIFGTTGCGKTHELKRRLGKPKRRRTLFWSPKEAIDNYAAFYPNSIIVRTASEVLEVLRRAGKRGDFHMVFVPPFNRKKDEALFSLVCLMMLAAGNLSMITDELHTVTSPTNAPDGWAKLCLMGRGFGVKIFGVSQRPASVDKAFIGSLSTLVVKRLSYPEDQKTLAKALGLPVADVANLTGYQFYEKNFATGKITKNN